MASRRRRGGSSSADVDELRSKITRASARPDRAVSTSSHAPYGFDVNGNLSVTGNGTVSGNLSVAGTGLTVTSTTGALIVPRMTTTQRNALTAAVGMIIYNTTDSKFQGYAGSSWVNLH